MSFGFYKPDLADGMGPSSRLIAQKRGGFQKQGAAGGMAPVLAGGPSTTLAGFDFLGEVGERLFDLVDQNQAQITR